MAFKPPKDVWEELERLDSTWRFVGRGPTIKPGAGPNGSDLVVDSGGTICEIIDRTLGVPYASAMADTPKEAIIKATEIAKTAAKPMTIAQKATNAVVEAQNAELRERIKELEQRIEATGEPARIKRPYNRRPKVEETPATG